jgi:photosystem II stability/assembly factor-like uncharacterized protein
MKLRVLWSSILIAMMACSQKSQSPDPSQTAIDATGYPLLPSLRATISPESTTLKSVTQTALPEYVLDVSFVNSFQGWLLGMKVIDNKRYYVLASTTDGGRAWLPISLDPIEYQVDWWNLAGIFFADDDTGWFYYPGVVFSTGDGGKSWTRARIEGRIETINRAQDDTLWAYEGRGATGVLWKVNGPSYANWEALETDFPTDMRSGAELTLLDDHQWWLMWWSSGSSAQLSAYLLFTNDQGRTWALEPSPCDGYAAQGGTFIPIDAQHYWLGCSEVLTSMDGTKAIFTSSDGGKTWTLKGKGTLGGDNNLSIVGIASSFGAISPDFSYMSLDKARHLLITHNGGTSWIYSSIPCAEDHIQALFINEQNGWVWGGKCVARTQDGGGTWECGLLPDGRPCSQL